MRALCWTGVNKLSVENVSTPGVINPHDAVIKVRLSTTCGSDLHLLSGYIPAMKPGDIIGHECIGEIIELGEEVTNLTIGDRVVIAPLLGCGECHYCRLTEFSLCDNTNAKPHLMTPVFGDSIAGVTGYSHLTGGLPGCHAEYMRVPFANVNAIKIPDAISDEQAIFLSDAAPTGFMGADLCHIKPGDTVAVWGCGGVGLMAMHIAYLLGAERVIAIDRFPERLKLAYEQAKAEVLNYEQTDILEALKEMTGGRGPDCCIDAVGMEAHGMGVTYLYDKIKQGLFLESDRPQVLRQAIYACRKGGTISIIGVYGGFDDKIPVGAAMNKALTFRMGQQHGQRYIPRLFDFVQRGELDPSYLITHRLSLEEAPKGYDIFKKKKDGCVRVVFSPDQKAA